MIVFFRLVRAFVALLGIALAASHFGELHVVLDNLSNFPVHFAAAFLVCAAVLAIAQDSRWSILSAVGCAIALVPVAPWYFPPSPQPVGAPAFTAKLLVSNVRVHNRQYARFARLIDEERPDVVGLIEVDARWLGNLPSLRRDYPFRFEAPDEHFIGLALYSKLPLAHPRLAWFGESTPPSVVATMRTPGGDVEIMLAHPLPPMNTEFAGRRNAQLREMGRYSRILERPVVLAGDLNLTMWNYNYRSLAAEAGFRNAREGYGIGATWPLVRALGIPIDHIMATVPVELRNFRVHRPTGSDHLPISAEFSLGAELAAHGSGKSANR